MAKATLEERFWEKVDRAGPVPQHRPDLGPCWLWTAAGTPDGYGYIWVPALGKNVRAARVAYELLADPIPAGLTIDHLCHRPACVRPSHLEAVTLQENIHRRRANGMSLKTHCPQGHPYDAENTYLARGFRHCRTCRRIQGRRHDEKRRQQRPRKVAPTHCKRGHPFDQANTYHHGGRRHCRTCRNATDRRLRRMKAGDLARSGPSNP